MRHIRRREGCRDGGAPKGDSVSFSLDIPVKYGTDVFVAGGVRRE